MKKSIITSLVILFVVFVNVAQAQTLENVLKNHFEAVGQEKMIASTSYHLKAKINQMGMELPMEMKIKKPGKFRVEMEMQGQKMVQAYDGEKGWMIAPWISPDPTDLEGDQLKQAMEQADLEGELYDYKKKGHTIDFIGKVNADGKEAYKLKVTTKDEIVKNYFIDANTYYIVKVKSKVSANGQSVDVEQRMSDYKIVNGVAMAMKIVSDSPMGSATILIEEFMFDENFDNSIFTKPANN